MEQADCGKCRNDDDEVLHIAKLFAPNLQHDGRKHPDGRRRDSFQKIHNQWILVMGAPEYSERHHHQRSGHQHPDHSGQRAEQAAQIVTHDYCGVDGNEAGQRLAYLHRAQKALVVEPMLLSDQVFAEIGDCAAAEAQPACKKEYLQQFQQAGAGNLAVIPDA